MTYLLKKWIFPQPPDNPVVLCPPPTKNGILSNGSSSVLKEFPGHGRGDDDNEYKEASDCCSSINSATLKSGVDETEMSSTATNDYQLNVTGDPSDNNLSDKSYREGEIEPIRLGKFNSLTIGSEGLIPTQEIPGLSPRLASNPHVKYLVKPDGFGDTLCEKEDSKSGSSKSSESACADNSGANEWEDDDPEIYLGRLKSNFYKGTDLIPLLERLERRIKNDRSKVWVKEFLEANGFTVIVELLDSFIDEKNEEQPAAWQISGYSSAHVTASITPTSAEVGESNENHQIHCVTCMRALVDSGNGLKYLIDHHANGFVALFARSLKTCVTQVKNQIFEILTALCLYNGNGHKFSLATLDQYKLNERLRSRFNVIMNDLKSDSAGNTYKHTLMCFLNGIIMGFTDIKERTAIRNELISLGLLTQMFKLKLASSEDAQYQCEIFQEQSQKDKESVYGFDIYDPSEVFQAIYQRVHETPNSAPFLAILQILWQMDQDNSSDQLWDTVETLVRKIVLMNGTNPGKTKFFLDNILPYLPLQRDGSPANRDTGVQTENNYPPLSSPLHLHRSFKNQASVSAKKMRYCLRHSKKQHHKSSRELNDALDKREERSIEVFVTPERFNNRAIDSDNVESFEREIQSRVDKRRKSMGLTNAFQSLSLNEENVIQEVIYPNYLDFKETLETRAGKTNGGNNSSRKEKGSKEYPDKLATINNGIIRQVSADGSPKSGDNFSKHTTKRINNLFDDSKPVRGSTPIPAPPPLPPPTPSRTRKAHGYGQQEEYDSDMDSPKNSSRINSNHLLFGDQNPYRTPNLSKTSSMKLGGSVETTPVASDIANKSSSVTNKCNKHSLSSPPPLPLPDWSNINGDSKTGGPRSSLSFPDDSLNRECKPATNFSRKISDKLYSSPTFERGESDDRDMESDGSLPQALCVPRPRHRMKTLNWTKLPASVVKSKNSIWNKVLTMPNYVKIDYDELEDLFSISARETPLKKNNTSSKDSSEIIFLDHKRSMNVNILLKQFKAPTDKIIQMIADMKHREIGSDRLRGLLNILPDKNEISLLKNYDGDIGKLGTAELFYYHLVRIPYYSVLIEALMMKEEFSVNADILKRQIDSVIKICRELMDNQNLEKFLLLVLKIGNFFNANNYAGNALGFKVSFLCKLMDTRSKTPRMTLLHYILDMACNLDPNILEFPRELSALRSVQKISMDSLNMEANEMHKNVEQLEEDVKNSNAEIKGKFLDFITFTKKKVKDLRADMENAQGMVKKLAGRYCEDEAKFNLQEFFLMFNNFCDKVEQAKKDNNQRKVNAENEIKRRARQPNFVASGGRSSLQVHEAENENMVEKLLAEIRKGEFKLHKRDSNNNGRCSVASTCSSVTDMAYNGEREPA